MIGCGRTGIFVKLLRGTEFAKCYQRLLDGTKRTSVEEASVFGDMLRIAGMKFGFCRKGWAAAFKYYGNLSTMLQEPL
jgi:hypothetical protein